MRKNAALVLLLSAAATALPLLQIGHHPQQQELHRRSRRSLFHEDEEDDDGDNDGMTNLDGADCDTNSIPQQLIRLENQLPTGRCVMGWDAMTSTVTGGRWFYYPNVCMTCCCGIVGWFWLS